MKVPASIFIFVAIICFPFINLPVHAQYTEKSNSNNNEAQSKANARYIVVLKDKAVGPNNRPSMINSIAKRLTTNSHGKLNRTYHRALHGFTAEMSEAAVKELRASPEVAFIEKDCKVKAAEVQKHPAWGLDRIDQRKLPINSDYKYNSTGLGVNVYVVDSGIRTTHQEFQGRAKVAFDSVNDGQNGNDCNGHGTHVAALIGGNTYGVAKKANLFSVRVLGCNATGSLSQLISGIEWITENHIAPAVVNISISGPASQALDLAIQKSIEAGVTYVVAAGNDKRDACKISPARIKGAITVGATEANDTVASYSNKGRCIDVLAPGSNILSASKADDASTAFMQGTSMASAHAAGVAALYLQNSSTASPQDVASAIKESATLNLITNITDETPNRLLYSLLTTPTPSAPSSPTPTGNRSEYEKELQDAKEQLNKDLEAAQEKLNKALKEAKTPEEKRKAHDTFNREKRAAHEKYEAAVKEARAKLDNRLDVLQDNMRGKFKHPPDPGIFCALANHTTSLGSAEDLQNLYNSIYGSSGIFVSSLQATAVGVFVSSAIASDRTGISINSIISEQQTGQTLGQILNEHKVNPYAVVKGIEEFLVTIEKPEQSCSSSK
jgi:aqualysin 1